MAVTLNLSFTVCKHTHWEDWTTYPDDYAYSFTGEPAWFEAPEEEGEPNRGYFLFQPDETGVFTISVSNTNGDTGTITITVVECSVGYTFCPADDVANISWLNPAGGWSTYIFAGLLTKSVSMGGNTTFKDSDKVLKYASRTDTYISRVVTTGYIPKEHVDYLRTLRYAIQAYLYNELTGLWDIPIIIEPDSFDEYDNKQNLYEVRLKFNYATELTIQRQ